ncbi:MAG: hypothetical protein IPK12_16875 [Gemmatimonadetes bacterium]|nr:hypothetical protein [Gemmatimonadota bacterium]
MLRHLKRFLLALPLLVGLGLTACADGQDPTAPAAPVAPAAPAVEAANLSLSGLPLVGRLLACPALPPAQASAWIGPLGGSVTVGPHRFVVPPGALAGPVRITMRIPSDPVVSVEMLPHGLQFQRPARLTLSYRHCGPLSLLAPKRVAYTSGTLTILEYLLSIDNLLAREVTGQVPHFSRYAVAW